METFNQSTIIACTRFSRVVNFFFTCFGSTQIHWLYLKWSNLILCQLNYWQNFQAPLSAHNIWSLGKQCCILGECNCFVIWVQCLMQKFVIGFDAIFLWLDAQTISPNRVESMVLPNPLCPNCMIDLAINKKYQLHGRFGNTMQYKTIPT